MTDKVVVITTCANKSEAKRIARAVVEARLAACVNIFGTPVESTYRWKGRVERAQEVLLLMKSARRRLAALRRIVERMHSYETPEFIAMPITASSPKYLAWLQACLAQPRRAKRETRRSRS